jgi:hypothetical protein
MWCYLPYKNIKLEDIVSNTLHHTEHNSCKNSRHNLAHTHMLVHFQYQKVHKRSGV